MKNFCITFIIYALCTSFVFAGSINPALYQSMRASSYRNNYNRQINTQPIPYWQAQSNFTTRNKVYQNYNNYNNSMYQYNTSVQMNRGYR